MNSRIEIWRLLAKEKYPKLNEDGLSVLSLQAASDWYNGADTELSKLFDQYVMLKNLKGIDNVNVESL
jgi:hypothetical protein